MIKKTTGLFLLVAFLLVLVGCQKSENENWKQSSLFEIKGLSMIGVKDKVGFVYDDNEVIRFYPNKENKYMWHFWFKDETKNYDKLTVRATQGNKKITLIDNVSILNTANNRADAHYPSLMSLPKSGMWKLEVYIDNNLFETLYIKVHEK